MSVPPKKIPNPIDKHVGARVRMRRLLVSMSQERLGEALGITFQQIQKYEKGANRIGASRLQQIAKILGVPVEFFFDGSPSGEIGAAAGFGDMPQPSFVSDFMATSEGVQLTRAFVKIADPQVRRRLIDLVETLASSQPARP
ncbi:MAG: helix-turn-helix transcriptional regulator [Bosea sp.]|jgi:transcriptional regulator with XRE-family HTH domain|nr:helix-turn-helix transcriptional regulator [Bosea sp. (in: a-proteobacteria)]